MSRDELKQTVAKLQALARRFDDAANRAFTLEDEENRHRDAATIRLVALLGEAKHLEYDLSVPEWLASWLEAGERMLDAYDAADMDAVHASRSSRRDEVKR